MNEKNNDYLELTMLKLKGENMSYKYIVCYPAKSNVDTVDKFILLDLEGVRDVDTMLAATLFDTPGEAETWANDLHCIDSLHDRACIIRVELLVISHSRTSNE